MTTIIPFNTRSFNRSFDRAMADLFREGQPAVTVPVDSFETEDSLVIRATVPGLSPDQLELTVEKNILTLKGEFKGPEIPEGAKVWRRESTAGEFQRSLRIPETFDMEKVNASFSHGILTVTIAKKEEVKPTRIQIPIEAN
jgi:HSP20 family protein